MNATAVAERSALMALDLHGFDQSLRAIPTEALGMLVQHHRDEAARLQKTRRAHGMMYEVPVGNEACLIWHRYVLAELRLEAERRDAEVSR